MNNSISISQEDQLLLEKEQFTQLLQKQDLQAALAYLNHRTPHRYTGIFRFEGDELHNEVLFDHNQAAIRQDPAVPLAATFCSLVGQQQAPVTILNALEDPQAHGIDTTVLSYCGVLIRNEQGQPYGTLCHYDMQRCQERTTDLPLLEAAAQLLYRHLHLAKTSH